MRWQWTVEDPTEEYAPGWGLPQASTLRIINTYGGIVRRCFAAAARTRVRDLLNLLQEMEIPAVACVWGKDSQTLLGSECDDLVPAYVCWEKILEILMNVPHPQACFDQRCLSTPVCVCVCVCVQMRVRSTGAWQTGVRAPVCVCVCV